MACAVIVAAGRGKRMNSTVAKQFLELGGRAVFVRTLEVFARHPAVTRIELVVPVSETDMCRKMIPGELARSLDIGITAGGKKRQDSVYNGLSALGDPGGVVLIHDGVRPFVSQDLITECIEEAEKCGACIAAVPAFDTLKKADCENFITGTVPRDCIWLAQTPQAFSMRIIREAFESAVADGFYATDEASLVERVGGKVRIVEGSRMNMKITSRGDLEIAEHLFKIIKNPDENPEVKNGK